MAAVVGIVPNIIIKNTMSMAAVNALCCLSFLLRCCS